MKKFTTLILLALLPLLASAATKIDGIYYNLDASKQEAAVTSGGFGYYTGSVTIPESFTYDGATYNVTSIGQLAFYGCGLTAVTIPNSVTEIGDGAFNGCYRLTSIEIPNNVTSIGESAFNMCSSLTSVTIPNSVTSIGEYAFSECYGLASITVESGNTIYDSRDNCNAIIQTASNTLVAGCKNTVIPNSVTSIGSYAFYYCNELTEVTIPNSVTSIGEYAFYDCSGVTSVTIPNSVTEIGDYAFNGCSGLTSITVESGNTKYDSRNNSNAIIETATNTLIVGCKNTIIPNSVTSVGYAAFNVCSNLTSVTIPNSVTSIGEYAFHYCNELTEVTIGNSVTTIGSYAFSGCSGLTSVTIPNSVTTIGSYAFSHCSSLTDVYCYATSVPTTDDWVFYYDVPQSSATLYVPRASIEAYKAATPWSGFGTIKAIEDITGVKNVSAEGNGIADGKYLKDGKLVIIKGGKEYDAAGAVK